MKELFDNIFEFAALHLSNLHPALGVEHMQTTLDFARRIAAREKLDVDLCIICAMLHDISLSVKIDFENETIDQNHGTRSAAMARPFLSKLNLKVRNIDIICDAIACHCFPDRQQTPVAKALWDADKLNLFSPEMDSHYMNYWMGQDMPESQAKTHLLNSRIFYYSHFYTQSAQQIARESKFFDCKVYSPDAK